MQRNPRDQRQPVIEIDQRVTAELFIDGGESEIDLADDLGVFAVIKVPEHAERLARELLNSAAAWRG